LYSYSENPEITGRIGKGSELRYAVNVDAVLDGLALKDALIAFYARKGDSNEDLFSMGEIFANDVLRGIYYDDMTGIPCHRVWTDRGFEFTNDCDETRGIIRGIDFADLKEVKVVIVEREARWTREPEKQSVPPETTYLGIK